MPIITTAQSQDLQKIKQLYTACTLLMHQEGYFNWDEKYPPISKIQADIKARSLFKMTDEEEIKAVITLDEYQSEEYQEIQWEGKNGTVLVVHRLSVHPKHQKQGIARQMMDFAEEWAIQNQYQSIRLDAYQPNQRLQQFYLNRNYKALGHVYLEQRPIPFICYEKILSR